jgi:two-component system phosphate regulon sensor histidine kinase PhoR
MESSLSFASDLIEALPESVCLYLTKTDLLIPNSHWEGQVGVMSRLKDLRRVSLEPRSIARHLEEQPDRSLEVECTVQPEHPLAHKLQACPVRGQNGVWLFFLRDETKVRRVEQMRKDFIANVSHELRTPLTAVRGYIETLMDPRFMTLPRVQQFLPTIFEHTERLHNLMLDLLSLSRLESPNTHIEIKGLVLADEIQAAIEAIAPLARLKNLDFQVRLPDDDVRVLANSEHLERILVNLLDNAVKYSPSDARVTVWTEVEKGRVWTHVRDHGVGIPLDEQARVFERFYRTQGARGSRERGSGLGLAIVKHIVQQLGGEIHVTSEPGRGSDFYFALRTPPSTLNERGGIEARREVEILPGIEVPE